MDQNIRNILRDLYLLDPNLQQDEKRLVQFLEAMIRLKPHPVLDQKFVARLKAELLNKSPVQNEESKIFNSINPNFMKKFNLAVGALAICLLLAASVVYLQKNQSLVKPKLGFNNKLKITSTSDNAFGKLEGLSQINTQGGKGGGNNASASYSSLTAESAPDSLPVPPTLTTGQASPGAPGMGGGSDARIMPPIDYPIYKYIYKGTPLDLSEAKRLVLKRLKGSAVTGDFSALLNTVSFGLVDLNSFPNLKLQSVSFVEQGGDNFNVYVDLDQSSISINGNWIQPIPYASSESTVKCMPESCGDQPPISIGDIPPDNELIAVANQFLAAHSISTSVYGPPEVQNEWRQYYAMATDKTTYYLPDIINVVYPVKINDQFVFDEGGNKTGLNVSVNVRNKKVASVWDLAIQNYESSMYDAETDVSRIMAIVERGGLYGYYPPESTKVVEVALGDPSIEFVKMWNYKNGISEELLIPSLIFPVTSNPSTDQYFRKSVVVPLIKEILNQNPGGPIPLMQGTDTAAPSPAKP